MTFTQLREKRGMIRTDIARQAGFNITSVREIEEGKNKKLSTLHSWAETIGGALRFVAEFPNRAPIDITGLRVPFDQRDHAKRTNNPRFHRKQNSSDSAMENTAPRR